MIAQHGDLPAGQRVPGDGTFPTGTSQWEKRNIALDIPVWDPKICIQCGKCALVCPHAAIRAKVYDPAILEGKPRRPSNPPTSRRPSSPADEVHDPARPGGLHRLRVVRLKPVRPRTSASRSTKAINMAPKTRFASRKNAPATTSSWTSRKWPVGQVKIDTVKGSQLLRPLFEYSGACAGAARPPTSSFSPRLFGDRAAHRKRHRLFLHLRRKPADHSLRGENRDGRGPAWSNSLFEDTAEFGLRSPARRRQTNHQRLASCSCGTPRGDRRRPGRAGSSTPTRRPRRESSSSAAAWPPESRSSRRLGRPEAERLARWPTTW